MRKVISIAAMVTVTAALVAAPVRAHPHPAAWLLDSPARRHLSAAGERSLLALSGLGPSARPPAPTAAAVAPSLPDQPQAPSGGTDVRINQPGDEFLPTCTIQNEVTLARHGQAVVAGWNDLARCDYLITGDLLLSGYGWSEDDGTTWHDGGIIPTPPGGGVAGDPVLAVDRNGNFYYATLASLSSGRSIMGVAKSTDGGKTWSPPVDASPGRSAGAFQDKEWLTVDATGGAYDGNVYVAWVEFGNVQDVLLSRSTNGGATFSPPIVLTKSSTQRGTGTQVAVGPQGHVYVLWETFDSKQLFLSVSTNGGASFSYPAKIGTVARIGHFNNLCFRWVVNGDIRVAEWPSMTVDTSGSADPAAPDYNPYRGTIYVAVPSDGAGADESDLYFTYSRDAGTTWSPLAKVNDDTTANDNFHPQVAVDGNGTVAVSWYDRRLSDDPVRANWEIDVFAAVSTDGGQTFSPNARVTDVSFPPAQTHPNTGIAADCYMGEYNGMVPGDPGTFLLDWGDNRDGMGLPDPNVYFDKLSV